MAKISPMDPSLDNIQVYENMIDDHLGTSYQQALEECISAQRASFSPKPKCAFDSSDCCQICCMDFTWNSTWHSAGQQSMDRKNCRQCGRLVCPACSKNKRPLPSLGHPYEVRVCDLCFFNPCVDEVIGVHQTSSSSLMGGGEARITGARERKES